MKNYFNNKFPNSIDLLKAFNDINKVKHFEIQNIQLSEFTLPTFESEGVFEGGSDNFRTEYRLYVEQILDKEIEIKNRKNPCIYIFELIEPDAEQVYAEYQKFLNNQSTSSTKNPRVGPALKEYKKKESSLSPTILYVGKSERPVRGRIVVHFGYYEKKTPGLQLVYWAKKINMKINLHIFEITDTNMKKYVEVFEKLLFVELKPLIGKR